MTKRDFKRGATGALCALALLAGASSCGSDAATPPSQTQELAARAQAPQDSIDTAPNTPDGAASQAPGPAAPVSAPRGASGSRERADRRGHFKVVRRPAKDARNIKMRDSGFLEEVVSDMAKTINPRFPVDVPVSFAELGEANAFYSPKERSVFIGYELLDKVIVLFLKNADRDDPKVAAKVAQQVVDTLSFVFYHEAAHAIIDLDDLPITGREEDAADQLATVMIVASAKSKAAPEMKPNGITHRAQGGAAAINGAMFFLLSSGGEGQSVDDLPFWDEHSLSQQRFYNILTWVYGSDPDKYAYLVDQKVLPRERAARGRGEFSRMVRSWLKIMEDAGAA